MPLCTSYRSSNLVINFAFLERSVSTCSNKNNCNIYFLLQYLKSVRLRSIQTKPVFNRSLEGTRIKKSFILI